MATPEALTKDAVRRLFEAAKAAGVPIAWWMPTPAAGSVGLPDFIACVAGQFVAVECKATKADGGRAPTKRQKEVLQAISGASGHAMVVQEEGDLLQLHGLLELRGNAYNHAHNRACVVLPLPEWRSEAVRTRRATPAQPKGAR